MPRKVVKISDEVAAILRGMSEQGKVAILPKGQLVRPLYEAVDKTLKALGGKWSRPAGGHVFPGPPLAIIQAALGAGEAVDHKRSLEQFFTPEAVIPQMIERAGIERGMHILEPSCGDGRLVRAAFEAGASFASCVEIDIAFAERMRDWMIAGHHVGGVWRGDFLCWQPQSPVPIDLVLMNPPFANRADIQHVRHAFDLLRPGGRLISIMSPHWTFAQGSMARDFRDFVAGLSGDWQELPAASFKGEGTGVNAGMLVLDKPV